MYVSCMKWDEEKLKVFSKHLETGIHKYLAGTFTDESVVQGFSNRTWRNIIMSNIQTLPISRYIIITIAFFSSTFW